MKDREGTQHQKKLNEAVNNGGGCSEIWEATKKSREKNQKEPTRQEPTRRSLLGLFGSGLLLTGADVTSAETPDQHDELNINVDQLFSAPQTRLILDELHPSSERSAKLNSESPVNIHVDEAKSDKVEVDDGRIVSTTVPSNLGEFNFLSINDSLIDLVTFDFYNIDEEEKRWIDSGSIGWPDRVEASLIGTKEEVVFSREVTNGEQTKISHKTGVETGQFGAFAINDTSGYTTVGHDVKDQHLLTEEFEHTSIEIFSSEMITQDSCAGRIAECFGALVFPLPTPCAACGYLCVTPVPGLGQAACLACLLSTCSFYILGISLCSEIWQCV